MRRVVLVNSNIKSLGRCILLCALPWKLVLKLFFSDYHWFSPEVLNFIKLFMNTFYGIVLVVEDNSHELR